MARVSLRTILFALTLSALTASALAQVTPQGGKGNPQTTAPQSAPAAPQGSQDRKVGSSPQNTNPVMEAMEINAAEIEAGKLATNKAQDARVKNFAGMMVKDHTEALTRLKSLHGAPPDVKPTAKHQETGRRLSKLSGAAFDREYMKAMVSGHGDALKFFEKHAAESRAATPAAADSEHEDFSQLARELLPTVRRHLDMAKEIQKDLKAGSSSSNPTSNPQDRPSNSKLKNPIYTPEQNLTGTIRH